MGPLVELTLDNGHYISVTGDGSEKLIACNEFFGTVPKNSPNRRRAASGRYTFLLLNLLLPISFSRYYNIQKLNVSPGSEVSSRKTKHKPGK